MKLAQILQVSSQGIPVQKIKKKFQEKAFLIQKILHDLSKNDEKQRFFTKITPNTTFLTKQPPIGLKFGTTQVLVCPQVSRWFSVALFQEVLNRT